MTSKSPGSTSLMAFNLRFRPPGHWRRRSRHGQTVLYRKIRPHRGLVLPCPQSPGPYLNKRYNCSGPALTNLREYFWTASSNATILICFPPGLMRFVQISPSTALNQIWISRVIRSFSRFMLTWFDHHAGGQRADFLQHQPDRFPSAVVPVSTMSTMTSDSPTMGASSMEPFSLMISTV